MPTTFTLLTSKDTWLYQAYPTSNYGSGSQIGVISWYDSIGMGAVNGRALLSFDLSDWSGFTITSATLKMYGYQVDSGRTYYVCKQSRDTWVETEATWNRYKSGSNWTAAGGDYVLTSPTKASFTPAVGWNSITVTALVQDAIDNSLNMNFLIKDATENDTSGKVGYFYAGEHATLYPYLEIVATTTDKTGAAESFSFGTDSVALEQTTYPYNVDSNNQAYIMNLRTGAWSFQDDCPFSNAIYRPLSQTIIGARRDIGNLATLNSGTTFDGDTITWTVQTGYYNFGQLDEIKGMVDEASQALKRFKSLYAEVRATGNITLTVYTEEDQTGKPFTIEPDTTDGVAYNMVRTILSRDIRGKYVSWKFTASVPAWVGETGVKVQARELK